MTTHQDLVPAVPWVARENQRFIAILRGLDEEAWKRPTYCTGWSAAEVVAHMTLGARFYAHVIPAGREGRLEMPFGAADIKEFWAYRERIGKELAGLPGSERVDRLESAVLDLQSVFEGIQAEDLGKEVWHWMRPCPVHSFPGQRLYELLLHDWDIQNHPDADLHPDAVGVATDILDFRLPFFYNNAPVPGLSGTFRFETEKPVRIWALKIKDGQAVQCAPEVAKFDAEFSAPASDIILLTTGRAALSAKESAGRLRIEGDRTKADALLGVLCRPF